MDEKIKNLLINFDDRISTGMDPITAVLGEYFKKKFPDSYLSRDRGYFIGYSSDKYGAHSDPKRYGRISEDIKKERSILEQIVKGIGTGIGLHLHPIFEPMIITDYIRSHFNNKDCHPEKRYKK